ncbi:hypothetical protein TRICI_005703 [Trichomonascus ciferrii]|uniref:Zn(2)-C6 fungal-type domain-containing protein n=1 Tax=Trichomonascus ciferrii TaxID=44093 RepID=A0A642UQK2_9ASCO|nr:hypothetical protein TRICI_005703 [Trichomonascus ciferrii]
MKTAVACDECRQSKVKCFNDGSAEAACRRCEGLGRKCVYNVKWKQRPSETPKSFRNVSKALLRAKPVKKAEVKCYVPERQDILDAIEAFFATQYQGIFPFIHKPTFVKFFKSPAFNPATYLEEDSKDGPDPLVLIAMLGLSARLCPPLVQKYGGFNEDDPEPFYPSKPMAGEERSPQAASKYFGWHARRMLQNEFDRPGLSRVQAFAMLSSHEWGERNAARGYMYISIASRMALVLGLGSSSDKSEPSSVSANISLEVKRRTLWGCYMMDHCISSGRNRVPSIRVDEISIPMPASEDRFLFGSSNNDEMTYHQAMEAIKMGNARLTRQLSLEGCKIIFFEIWARIAKWVGEVGGRKEAAAPWQDQSTYFAIMREINLVEMAFPAHIRFSKDNMEAHIANNTAGTYGYMHCMVYLCKIFLNREYLYLRPQTAPTGWWAELFKTLVTSADNCVELISSLNAVNQMVVAPFTGFIAFTLVGINLYMGSFPPALFRENFAPFLDPTNVLRNPLTGDFTDQFKQERYEMVSKSIEILDTWNKVWSIAHNWMALTKNLSHSFSGMPMESNEKFKDYGQWDIGDDEEPTTHNPPETISSLNNSHAADVVPDLEFLNNVDMNLLIPGWNDVMSNDLVPFTNFT